MNAYELRRGDLVYLKKHKDNEYSYSWHVDYPNTRFIGAVVDKIMGRSYNLVLIKIVYPLKGEKDWSKSDHPNTEPNRWVYDNISIERKVDINKLSDKALEIIIGMLL